MSIRLMSRKKLTLKPEVAVRLPLEEKMLKNFRRDEKQIEKVFTSLRKTFIGRDDTRDEKFLLNAFHTREDLKSFVREFFAKKS